MKRKNGLFNEIISDKNLNKAIDIVNKTHRWNHYPDKPNKKVLWVEKTKKDRIEELRNIIINGFEPSPATKKRRYDSNAKKWRDISEPRLYPDQYIHHALIQVLEPIMMRGMDNWCCGSIKGRGAHYGVKAIKKWMKSKKGVKYCLEADIRHFYDSLQPKHVVNRLKKLIKDYRTLDLVERILSDGVQIGCYCSQWFANVVLQELDHIIREKCDVTHSIRYMDNFTIFSNRKKSLRKVYKVMKKWLNERDLEIKGNWQIFRTADRYPNALGYRYKPGFTMIRKHNLLKIKRQVKKFWELRESGQYISVKFAQGLLSRLGMLRHCNSVSIYERFVPNGTQRHLKDIVRKWQKEAQATWNTYLEAFPLEA